MRTHLHAHTQASCCDTLTFLTAVQLQEKRSFSTHVNQRRANNTPPASSAEPELLSSVQKETFHFYRVAVFKSEFQKRKLPIKETSSIKIMETCPFPPMVIGG